MNAGDLRHRIKITSNNGTTVNDNGFSQEDWITFKTCWASKRGLKGREYYNAAAVQSETDFIYKIRYQSGITSAMRVVEGGKTYNIRSVIDTEGLKKELTITVFEVVISE